MNPVYLQILMILPLKRAAFLILQFLQKKMLSKKVKDV